MDEAHSEIIAENGWHVRTRCVLEVAERCESGDRPDVAVVERAGGFAAFRWVCNPCVRVALPGLAPEVDRLLLEGDLRELRDFPGLVDEWRELS
jgi:hypothetical protein